MRKRYIETTTNGEFLDIRPNSEQFYTFTSNEDHCYVSAMSYMSGLYPMGL